MLMLKVDYRVVNLVAAQAGEPCGHGTAFAGRTVAAGSQNTAIHEVGLRTWVRQVSTCRLSPTCLFAVFTGTDRAPYRIDRS